MYLKQGAYTLKLTCVAEIKTLPWSLCACTSMCQLSWLADGMLPAPQDSSVLLLVLFIHSR